MNTNTPYSYQLVANQRTHDGYILSAAAREVAEIFGEPVHRQSAAGWRARHQIVTPSFIYPKKEKS